MSSGYGLTGGTSRCFGEWQRFLECYTNADTDHPVKCTPHADDYFECLYHSKERARVLQIQKQLDKNSQKAKHNGDEFKVVTLMHSLPEFLGLDEPEDKK